MGGALVPGKYSSMVFATGQALLCAVLVLISSLAVLGVSGVLGVKVSRDRLPPGGDIITAFCKAMVVSPVVKLEVLPVLVLVSSSGSPVGGGGGVASSPSITGSGQFKPHRANVALLPDDPVVGDPSQAARTNAAKVKADTEPIRMIFPTTQIIHR